MLVAQRFPGARQAWLEGSVVLGLATETSDLDIVVLLDDVAGAYPEMLTFRGWLVELFVHTEGSFREFVTRDLARRRRWLGWSPPGSRSCPPMAVTRSGMSVLPCSPHDRVHPPKATSSTPVKCSAISSTIWPVVGSRL